MQYMLYTAPIKRHTLCTEIRRLEVAPFDLRRHSSQVQGPGRLEEMAVTAAAQQASQPVQNCCMNKNTIEDVFV